MVNIILPFVARTVVLYTLGAQYQGLNSLFMSILHVLNLANLGFSSAVIYILYKPIAEEDKESVCAIMAYLKKVYQIVGLVILCAGLLIIPFLPTLISGDAPDEINIYIPYILYLINSVISYWGFAYKEALLTAMQRVDIVDKIYTATSAGFKIAQLAVLLIYPNYYIYVLVLPVFTVLNNILTFVYSKKYFPDIEAKGTIEPEIRKNLIKQIKGIVIGKVGDVARNGFDSIVISAFLGLVAVAIYDNYFYVFSAVYGISLSITEALQASIGNSIAVENVEKNLKDANKFSFIFEWLMGWFSICLCCLYQPFMLIWMRGNTEMLFSTGNMLLFVVYFYAITMNNIRNLYVNGAGLYWELRTWYILEAVGNIVLNLVLGYFFGVTGIILATIITIFVCNFITRTNVLFKEYFKTSPKEFYLKHLIWFVAFAVNCAITYMVCGWISVSGIPGLILKGLVCAVLPNVIFFACYFKTDMFKESAAFVKRVIQRH